MLRRLFGRKPKPPTIPLEYRKPAPVGVTSLNSASTIPDGAPSTSTVVAQVVDVDDANFEQVVLQSNRLTVVDFWAEWCQPCEVMSLYVAWLGRDFGSQLLVTALDVDENAATSERFQVMGLPTLVFFRNGQEVARQVGLLHYEELYAQVETLLAQDA